MLVSAQMPGKSTAIEQDCSCTANWLIINSTDADLWAVVGPGSFSQDRTDASGSHLLSRGFLARPGNGAARGAKWPFRGSSGW